MGNIVMVGDFETLGLDTSKCFVLSYGYVIGNLDTGEILIYDEFAIGYQANKHLLKSEIDLDTIYWWLKQIESNEKLRQYFYTLIQRNTSKAAGNLLHQKLVDLNTVIREYNVQQHWCTDKSFDTIILQNLYNSTNLSFPFTYKQCFEARYFLEKYKEIRTNDTTKIVHCAKDDADILFHFLHTLNIKNKL